MPELPERNRERRLSHFLAELLPKTTVGRIGVEYANVIVRSHLRVRTVVGNWFVFCPKCEVDRALGCIERHIANQNGSDGGADLSLQYVSRRAHRAPIERHARGLFSRVRRSKTECARFNSPLVNRRDSTIKPLPWIGEWNDDEPVVRPRCVRWPVGGWRRSPPRRPSKQAKQRQYPRQ